MCILIYILCVCVYIYIFFTQSFYINGSILQPFAEFYFFNLISLRTLPSSIKSFLILS